MFTMFKQTFKEWQDDKVPVLAAALAYYTIFALAPLLIIVISVLGLFFSQGQAQEQLVSQLQSLFGSEVADTIRTMIEARAQEGGNVVATIVGVIILIVGATGAFVQLQSSLNTIWEVEPAPGGGLWHLVKVRLLSFGMILTLAFLLLVSLVISSTLSALNGALSAALPGADVLWQVLNIVVSLAVITLLFALMFKYLPDARIRWRDVWVGAAFTALLFVVGKFLLGLYLGNSGVASSYGAAGSLVLLLLWVFYSAQIILFGGEFTQVYAKRQGDSIEPAEHAVKQG